MKHLSDEELVEHYYGGDEPAAARHVETCARCASAYAALSADLCDVKTVDPPPRDAGYGEQVWAALSRLLSAYPSRRPAWSSPAFRFALISAAACALLVGAAFYAGRVWEHRQQPQPATANAPLPAPRRVVVVVLSDHLDRSERLLVELKHADASDSETISPLRDEARNLLAANRKCRQEAQKTGDPALTKALDHLNQVLTQLADQPGGLNAAAITRLQNEMDTDGLLFEVRVLRSRIPNQEPEETSRLKGGTV
jgi:hypothetical protein